MANPPTEDLSFATAGTKTASSAGEKLDGFEMSDIPDEEVVNYRWDGQHQKIDWLEGQPSRIVTDLRTAIDDSTVYLTGTELFSLDGSQNWDDGDVTKTTPGSVINLATDSRRVYYISGTKLYAATADAVASEQNEWSASISWISGADILTRISTDGSVVAVLGVGTVLNMRMSVFDAETGAFLWTVTSAASIPDGAPGIICASDAVGRKVWVGNATAGGYPLYLSTPGGIINPLTALGFGNTAKKIALIQNAVLVGNDGTVDFVQKEVGTSGGIIATVSISGTELQWIYGRDDLFAYGTSGVAGAAPLATNLGNVGELGSATVLGDAGPSIWGDGRLFTPDRVIRSDGIVEHVFASPSTGDIALSGPHLWSIISGALVARPVQFDQGSLWVRHINPVMDFNTNESQASSRFIARMMW